MAEPRETEPRRETDPEALAKALEIELIMKRASWEKARQRRGRWRALSFFFLFLVILGALLAWFYFATELRRHGGEGPTAGNAERGR